MVEKQTFRENELSSNTTKVADGSFGGILNGNKTGEEYAYLRDVAFNVKILAPGIEPFEIHVSSMELVQEVYQLLMDREDTCHRTCFSLQLDGVTLDNFSDLKSIDGLKDGSVLKVVEEPYTTREARIHIRHVRDLIKCMEPADVYNGMDCMSLSFLTCVTSGDILDKRKCRTESVDCTPPAYIMPNNCERPVTPLHVPHKDLPPSTKFTPCVKVMTTSAWNPPPGYRRLHGDFIYLYVLTVEDKKYHITASSRGFFVNQSTDDTFNASISQESTYVCHSLVDLISHLSPVFKRTFSALQKRRTSKHPFERVSTPYQVYCWLAPRTSHSIDFIRAEDAFSSRLGYEEHIPGQTRDWNEEIQTTRELPRVSLSDRLIRERAIFKVHSDFVSAAIRGAVAVIDGNVLAINPGDEAKMQMFIWNNIFFSLGFDVKDHYKELGGDAAAFVAPRNDLHGVKAYNSVDTEGLYMLGTAIVDYRGYRVTAQSIIPGILEREQEQSVVYGSVDFGKTVLTNDKYLQLLNQAGQQLKIANHSVLDSKQNVVELCSSVECKGIIGNDGRHYILDLLRTFPPDMNFLLPTLEADEQVHDLFNSKIACAFGLPVAHKHKLACLRQELVDSFVDNRYVSFIKFAAHKLNQTNANHKAIQIPTKESSLNHAEVTLTNAQNKESTLKNGLPNTTRNTENGYEDKEGDSACIITQCQHNGTNAHNGVSAEPTNHKFITELEMCNHQQENQMKQEEEQAKKLVQSFTKSLNKGDASDLEESTREIVKEAAYSVGSLKDTEFDIRFNPDVFSPGVLHPDSDTLLRERRLTRQAADFLLEVQIPAFISDCEDHTSAPLDGISLSEFLHTRGINMRYLGIVASQLTGKPHLAYLYSIVVHELVCRSIKHRFALYLQNLEMTFISLAVSHFLNCLFSSTNSVFTDQSNISSQLDSNHITKKRNKKRGRRFFLPFSMTSDQAASDWKLLTSKQLWSQIRQEARAYFLFDLDDSIENVESFSTKYNVQKVSLLRSLCMKCGVQLVLRDYNLDQRSRFIFNDEDILNMFPVAKHINPCFSDAFKFYTSGQSKIQHGYFREGYDLINEALNLLNSVYGVMHPEIVQCVRLLARLSYILGEHQEALQLQYKATLMSERVNGVDHSSTIAEYMHLSLYCFANGYISTSLKLLYRARYLMLIVVGENHPEMTLINSNIGLILHSLSEYSLSLNFLEVALKQNKTFYGEKSLKVAVSHHLVARSYSCMGEFRLALQHEKETFSIYKFQLGEEHEKTRESSECLRHLTQQAVTMQKKMNDLFNGKLNGSLPPLQIQTPSASSVLEMLNVINGILFVQISPKDIEVFKSELKKRNLRILNKYESEKKTPKNDLISFEVPSVD